MYIYMILSAAILAAGVILTVRKKDKLETNSLRLTAAVVISAALLAFPYFRKSYDILISVLYSLRHGVGIILLEIDPELVEAMESGTFPAAYRYLMYICYVLAPIFGSITVLSFSKSLVDRLRILWSKDVHLFSSLNEKSISIAEHIRKNRPHAKIVFFSRENTEDSMIRKAGAIGAIFPANPLNKFHFRKNRHYSFYQIDSQRSGNLNSFIGNYELFRKLDPKILDDLEVKCFTDSESAELIRKIDSFLSSQSGPIVKVSFINEENCLAYGLMHDLIKVIDTEKQDNEFMIIGSGSLGISILKALIWLFDSQSMDLTADLVCSDAADALSSLKLNCPDLINADLDRYMYMPVASSADTDPDSLEKDYVKKNYNIRFFNADPGNFDLEEVLTKGNVDPDMIFITTGDDISNQAICERTQRILARKHDDIQRCPAAVQIENDRIFDLLRRTKDEKTFYFGNQETKYANIFEINSILEDMAKRIHMAYLNEDSGDMKSILNRTGYYRLSNHESSLAQALTIEYRVKHILSETKNQEGTAKQRIQGYLSDPVKFKKLCELEHTRWLNYQRTEGWTRPSIKQQEAIAKKYGNGKTIKDDTLLLHPANVENAQLAKAEAEADRILSEVNESYVPTDYVNKDGYILGRIPQIITDDLLKLLEE